MLLKSMREAIARRRAGRQRTDRSSTRTCTTSSWRAAVAGRGLGLAERLVEQLTRRPRLGKSAPQRADRPAAPASQADFVRGDASPLGRGEPAAQRSASRTETVIAHAALETGWGRHLPADGWPVELQSLRRQGAERLERRAPSTLRPRSSPPGGAARERRLPPVRLGRGRRRRLRRSAGRESALCRARSIPVPT